MPAKYYVYVEVSINISEFLSTTLKLYFLPHSDNRVFIPSLQFYDRSIQGVSRLVVITAGGDFLGLCDQKSSYKYVSDFGRLRSYDRLKLRIEGNDY
jgi:hypothetical protein